MLAENYSSARSIAFRPEILPEPDPGGYQLTVRGTGQFPPQGLYCTNFATIAARSKAILLCFNPYFPLLISLRESFTPGSSYYRSSHL
jgi:hypothetical protein